MKLVISCFRFLWLFQWFQIKVSRTVLPNDKRRETSGSICEWFNFFFLLRLYHSIALECVTWCLVCFRTLHIPYDCQIALLSLPKWLDAIFTSFLHFPFSLLVFWYRCTLYIYAQWAVSCRLFDALCEMFIDELSWHIIISIKFER